jgi:predicted secreted hydrolase
MGFAALAMGLLALGGGYDTLRFPKDHGNHSDAPVEWWYYTGHLQDAGKREYGFQLTFFRVRELHLAHFAWTDVSSESFRYEEKSHLGLPGIAEAAQDRLSVSNEDWSAQESNGVHRLHARGRAWELDLALRAAKPPASNGPGGLSRKGPGENDYSHYVSITRLQASGRFRDGDRRGSVSGTAWFDHEWGPGVLPRDAVGWDWFALQLSDGSDLMLFRMRDQKGRATPFSSGTFVSEKGDAQPVRWQDVSLGELDHWKSIRSKGLYPSKWRIAVASLGLDVTVLPLVPDQELITEQSTGVVYWEGTCRVEGTRRGRPVGGRAYAELTGYARPDMPGLASRLYWDGALAGSFAFHFSAPVSSVR